MLGLPEISQGVSYVLAAEADGLCDGFGLSDDTAILAYHVKVFDAFNY